VVFRQLAREEVGQVATIMLKEVNERLKAKNITLVVTDKFRERLLTEVHRPGPHLICSKFLQCIF